MAAKRRHWKEKDGRYWARLAITEQLRPSFEMKTQLTEPLGGDLTIADRNHAAAVARLHARLDAARRAMTTATALVPQKPELRSLDPGDRDRAAWDHYTSVLAEIENKRAAMPSASEIRSAYEETMRRVEAGDAGPDWPITSRFNVHSDYELLAGARYFDANLRKRRLAALRSALPADDTTFIDGSVHDYVALHGLDAPQDGPAWRSLAEAFTRAEIEALQRSVEYDDGKVGGQPTDPLIRPPAAAAIKSETCRPEDAFRGLHHQSSGRRLSSRWRRQLGTADQGADQISWSF